MRGTAARVALLVSVAIALVAAGSASAADPLPGDCQKDRKLIEESPIWLSTIEANDGKTSWWELTKAGLDDAGVADYETFIETVFGTTFESLEEAVEALVDAVRPLDKNGNGYVCAIHGTGTKAHIGDPNWSHYYFGVIDDKRVKA